MYLFSFIHFSPDPARALLSQRVPPAKATLYRIAWNGLAGAAARSLLYAVRSPRAVSRPPLPAMYDMADLFHVESVERPPNVRMIVNADHDLAGAGAQGGSRLRVLAERESNAAAGGIAVLSHRSPWIYLRPYPQQPGYRSSYPAGVPSRAGGPRWQPARARGVLSGGSHA
ncbi:hypothetical protein [Burkholderia sp. BCC0322]|uniref:hypothetical protein n=1 Tax=unclassified Burkholderia TaxID=2613784 RepID=UPI00158F3E23|nr:hypothetical protein [Burkholderia sp. BCC0322]